MWSFNHTIGKKACYRKKSSEIEICKAFRLYLFLVNMKIVVCVDVTPVVVGSSYYHTDLFSSAVIQVLSPKLSWSCTYITSQKSTVSTTRWARDASSLRKGTEEKCSSHLGICRQFASQANQSQFPIVPTLLIRNYYALNDHTCWSCWHPCQKMSEFYV